MSLFGGGFLATTDKFGVSKTDGLLAQVPMELGVDSSQMAYVGDGEDQNMRLARPENIFAFPFVVQKCDLEVFRSRVNSLHNLESIMSPPLSHEANYHDDLLVHQGRVTLWSQRGAAPTALGKPNI